MKQVFVTRARKMTSLIIVTGITGLCLVSLLPWITDGSMYLNMEVMRESDNIQIKGLVEDLEIISTCFWLLIIFGLISFLGITIHLSRRYTPLAQMITLIGCVNIVFSVLVIFLLFTIIKNIEDIKSISAAVIVSYLPIKHAYLPMITGVVSLLGSALYIRYVVSNLIKRFIDIRKQKTSAKKQDNQKTMLDQLSKKEEVIVIKKTYGEEKPELPKRILPTGKPVEPEKKVLFEEPTVQETYSEPELRPPPEPKEEPKIKPFVSEESSDVEETYKKPVAEEKKEQPSQPEPSSEIVQEQPSESEEPSSISPLFEKALSSAIEKRHIDLAQKDEDKKQQPEKEKISVRCPQCENIFTIEKVEDITKTECPKCGNKGFAKH